MPVEGAGVRIRFEPLDRFDEEDLAELRRALPGDADLAVAGTSSATAIAGVVEVISEVVSIGVDGLAIAQAVFFLRDKLGRAQVVKRRGAEIEVAPDRELAPGHLYVETPEGLKIMARPEDLSTAIEALRRGEDDE